MTTVSTIAPSAHNPRRHEIERFERLLSHYNRAQIDLINYDEDDEEGSDRLVDIQTGFEEAIFAYPAPNMKALLAKVEILMSNGMHIDPDNMQGIVDDIMALGGIERSPTFQPHAWLYYFQQRGGQVYRHEGRPMLACPAEAASALARLNDLTDYQREAVIDHLNNLDRELEA